MLHVDVLQQKVSSEDCRRLIIDNSKDLSEDESNLLHEILDKFEFDAIQEQALVRAAIRRARFSPSAFHIDSNNEDIIGICPYCISPSIPPLCDYLAWREVCGQLIEKIIILQTDDLNADRTQRIITTQNLSSQEELLGRALHLKTLNSYIRQTKTKDQLTIFIQAAKKCDEALDHTLLFGPPGLGKTALAHITMKELNVNLCQANGPVLERAGDLAALLTSLEPHDTFFIDEVHRLSPVVEETPYPALEDYQLDITIGKGPATKPIRIDLLLLTLIDATTHTGMFTNLLRDRFGIVSRLELYEDKDLATTVSRSTQLLQLDMGSNDAMEIAKRSRGTPRIVNRLLHRVYGYADVENNGVIDAEVADATLIVLDVDAQELDVMDKKFLEAILYKFGDGLVGLDNIAAITDESTDTIKDVIEPYLIQQEFLRRTPHGRVTAERSYLHFGLKITEQCGSINI